MGVNMEKPITIPPSRAEDLSIEELREMPVDVAPIREAYRGIHNSLASINEGKRNADWIAVIGPYGSGKTFLLRRIAHETVENYNRIIPIYFYLGSEGEILLFRTLGERFLNDLDNYVNRGVSSPRIQGSREKWRERLEVLREVYRDIEASRTKDVNDVELFFKAMRELNYRGYYPLIIFDEFERLVYTGEGLIGSPENIRNFVTLSDHFLELTRGILFSGVGLLSLTDTLPNLVYKAKTVSTRGEISKIAHHVSSVEEYTKYKYEELKIASPNIVFGAKYHLDWNTENLINLCSALNIHVPRELIEAISIIFPTPRSIISIARRSHEKGLKIESKKDVYQIIKPRIDKLMNTLMNERIDDKPLIHPNSKWDERFDALMREGFFIINRKDIHEVGKIFWSDADERTIRIRTRALLNALEECGLYIKLGKGRYVLKKEILAYLLEFDRLPTGEVSSEDEIVRSIKESVIKRREDLKKRRKIRETRTSGA